ncbi:hypothetical protein ACFQ6N_31815 [Kitasatospora sp. NPDC056446]|uniref:hypothetical protein n=1 Tax=Kitasatospora sp. NPDC056446 TaxID=3345819 RepID=UPI0036C26768
MTPAARSDRAAGATRPWLGRTAALIAVLTCLFVGIVLAYVFVGTLLAFGLGALYIVTTGIGLAKLRSPVSDSDYNDIGGALLLVLLATLMACGAGADAWHNHVLGTGRNIDAVVTTEHVEKSARGGTKRTYTLVSKGEGTVPGGPLAPESRRFKPGDTVTVRMDPAGRVAPKLPGEADSPASLGLAVGLGTGIALLLLWYGHEAGRPPRKPRPPGPWRDRLRRLDGLPLTAAATAVSVPWLLLLRLVQGKLGLTIMIAAPYPFAALAAFGALVRDEERKRPQGLVLLAVGVAFTLLALFL